MYFGLTPIASLLPTPSLPHASGRRVLMPVSPSYLPWPRCVACWIAGPRSGWDWGPRGSGVLTAAAPSSRFMLTSKWSGPQAISSEAPPTPPRLPTEVMSCPSSGPVPVLLAWSPGSQSVGAQSPGVARGASSPRAAGAQGGHLGSGLRAPGASPPPGRVAAGGGSSGWPLGVLAAKDRVPSAHLAGLNAQMLTECTRTLSRGLCWGTLSPAGCWNTVRPLALWACRLVREGGKTELGRLWWGSPLSDAFA